MKLNHDQWVEVSCILLQAEGHSPDTVETERAAATSMRLNDLMEPIHHGLFASRFWPKDVRTKANALLRRKGLPPLAHLDTGFRATCRRILKRGRIRNDEEFYVVAEILGGPDYDELSSADQKALGQISHAYEKKTKTA